MFSARSCSPELMKIFAAGDLVAAIGLRLGLAAQQAQVGAAMGLGQAHRAGPFTRRQLGQVGGLLFGRAVGMQTLVGAVREAGVHGPRLVAGVQHFEQALIDQIRQALAAEVRIGGQRRPAAFDILGIGLPEALGCAHLMGGDIQAAALAVAAVIEGQQHFGSELSALFEHGIDGLRVEIGVGRDLVQARHGLQQLMHHELHIAQRWRVLGHRELRFMVSSDRRGERLRTTAGRAGTASTAPT